MVYETNNEKLNNYFLNRIFPYITNCGIDYNKTILELCNKLSLSKKKVEEYIQSLVEMGKLSETRILDLPKEELIKRQNSEKEIEKEVKEVII
jgi:polyhydroxyalkanoate synthesis regulator phasin